jgi:hypothetical protein
MLHSAERGKRALELLNFFAENERRILANPIERAANLVAQLGILSF